MLINLGYGGDNLGYSDAPANVPTPFGLFPDVNGSDLASTNCPRVTQPGIQNRRPISPTP